MNQDKLNELFHSTSDEKYKKFLCDRGWEFDTEETLQAAYARMAKASAGEPLSEEEFLLELDAEDAPDLGRQVYSMLLPLVEQGALRAIDLYLYAHHRWCLRRPEAVIACQTGPKRWAVNSCGEEIPEDRAKEILNGEWGFEVRLIEIIGTPYYDATDWNFIQFCCRGVKWVMHNDSLDMIYQ